MRPEAVLAYKLDPSEEYQTRSTAPVAREGRPNSMAELPMRRQPMPLSAAWTHHGRAARQAANTALDVAPRHMDRVYCIPTFISERPLNGMNLYRFVLENPIGYLLAVQF